MNKYTASLAFILAMALNISAQKTPQELTDYLFRAFKAENIKAIGNYVATPDEALLFSKKLGYSYNKEQGDDYKEAQLKTDTAFIDQCKFILSEGKKGKGINWATIQFVKYKSGIEMFYLSSLDDSKTVDIGTISAIFTNGTEQFILTFGTAFDASGRWRITGEEIKLKRYTDE